MDEATERSSGPTPPRRRRSRGLAANLGSLVTSTAFERAMRFVLYASVGSAIGVEDLGRLTLSVAIFQVVSRFATAGLNVLGTREVARDTSTIGRFLVNGSLVTVATSLVGYVATLAFVTVAGYGSDTTVVIWAMLAGLLPFCWTKLTEAVLVGTEDARFIVAVTVPVNLVQIVAALALIAAGQGVATVALTISATYVFIAALQFGVIIRHHDNTLPGPDRGESVRMTREALPFLGIDGVNVLRSSSGAIIISLILGETAVGVYSAASQLQMPLRLVGNAVGTGLFPVLVKAYRRGIDALRVTTSFSVGIVAAVVLPAAVGLTMLSDDLIALVFRNDGFAESADILQIIAWSGFTMAIASILGRALVAAGEEIVTLRIAVVNTTVQIGLSIWLTSVFGLIGTAGGALAVALLNLAQHLVPLHKLLGRWDFIGSTGRPVIAAAGMAFVLAVIPDVHVLVDVVVGGVAYLAILLGVARINGSYQDIVKGWDEVATIRSARD